MRDARNFAFIDSNNLHLGIRGQGWTLDYRKFRVYLQERYGVLRAYLFIGYIAKNADLYGMLESWGYVLILKPTTPDSMGKVKGNCDGELILQAMIDLSNYHQAVIVTGDGDFACLVKYLREHDKLCCLLVPDERRYSGLLKTAAKKNLTFLNRLRRYLEYMKRTPGRQNRREGFSS